MDQSWKTLEKQQFLKTNLDVTYHTAPLISISGLVKFSGFVCSCERIHKHHLISLGLGRYSCRLWRFYFQTSFASKWDDFGWHRTDGDDNLHRPESWFHFHSFSENQHLSVKILTWIDVRNSPFKLPSEWKCLQFIVKVNKCCELRVEAERRVSEKLHASQKEATHEHTANKMPPKHTQSSHTQMVFSL